MVIRSERLVRPLGIFCLSYYFPDLSQRFTEVPATELIPVFLPAAIFYKFLPLGIADLIKDIFLLSLTLFSIGSIIEGICGRFYTISIMILIVGYPSFIHQIGESYATGYVITYLSLTLYFIYQATIKEEKSISRKIYLIISGIFYCLSLMSAILSIIYIIPIVFFFFLNIYSRKKIDFYSFLENSKWFVFGGFISLIIVYLISIKLYGITASLPLANNIRKLISFANNDAFRVPLSMQFIKNANWLLMPAFVCSFSFIEIINNKYKKVISPDRETSSLITSILIVGPISFLILLFLNLFMNQWTLQYSYFSQSLPFIFLSFGGCLYFTFGKNKGYISILPSLLLTISSLISTRFIFIHAPITYLNQTIQNPDIYKNFIEVYN